MFEELDYSQTPLGELVLRRRTAAALDEAIVYEVKLAGEFLMSSVVNDSEIALAELAIAELGGADCSVLVGGLGLGCTAKAVLEFDNVKSLVVAEYLPEVIRWHKRGLVPLGDELTGDPRCRLVHADFFALADTGFDADAEADIPTTYDAIVIDIDHSPRFLLEPHHAAFYDPAGLRRLAGHIAPGGVFALWSADPPDAAFVDSLQGAFETVRAESIEFFNAIVDSPDTNTIYIAKRTAR
ncbi:MAG: spermidine synthase [Phycisphaerae bacterium]|jgi:spermidine synthase|nr:spermidine synthase [Phycisphaerae bacterium]MDP7288368.1 spermidine synthase [Phycisphaerae bacterium]